MKRDYCQILSFIFSWNCFVYNNVRSTYVIQVKVGENNTADLNRERAFVLIYRFNKKLWLSCYSLLKERKGKKVKTYFTFNKRIILLNSKIKKGNIFIDKSQFSFLFLFFKYHGKIES